MNHFRQLTLSILLFTLVAAAMIQAHDEPPKTAQERAEQEQARNKASRLGIKQQHVWVIKPSKSGGIADSSLWLTNRYDRAGNLVEQTVFDTSGTSRNTSIYDDQSLWLEELSYEGDSLEDRTVFVYGRDGLISHILNYNNLGKIIGQLDYMYSNRDQTISLTKRGPLDSLQYSILCTYEPGSAFKRQIEAVQTNADGSLRTRVQNQYSENRRVKKSVFGSDGKLTHAFSYTYTPGGDFSEIVKRMANDSILFHQNCQYTQEGLLSTISERDGSGAVTRTLRYIYDFFERAR